jgi:hypothetical protein
MSRTDARLRGLAAGLRATAAGALLVASLAGGACLSKPALQVRSYSIDPPPARTTPSAGGRVLSLERVLVAAPYSGRPLTYRLGDHRVEQDPYARFASSPSWLLTAAIRGYLENADFVRDVIQPGSALSADARIGADAVALYGDLENPAEPAAVLTLQFRALRPGSSASATTELLNRTYTRRIRVGQGTPEALVGGWNRALAEIMKEFEGDLKALPLDVPKNGGG